VRTGCRQGHVVFGAAGPPLVAAPVIGVDVDPKTDEAPPVVDDTPPTATSVDDPPVLDDVPVVDDDPPPR
jgi:hypothetical protein